MRFPDCLGLEINEASRLLRSRGADFRVKTAFPFFKGEPKKAPEGPLMVIGQKEEDGALALTVCAVPPEGDEHERK